MILRAPSILSQFWQVQPAESICALQWSPDGQRLLAIDSNRRLIALDAHSGAECGRLPTLRIINPSPLQTQPGTWEPPHRDDLVHVMHLYSWSADSRHIATCAGCAAFVWELNSETGAWSQTVRRFSHSSLVSCVAFQRQGLFLASGTVDGLLSLWGPDSDEQPIARTHTGASVTHLAWSAKDRFVASATSQGYVALWAVP